MQSKAEEAYQIIKHKIIMLEMRPTSDVSEEELIQELGISRTPIREAIQRLAKDRFVIIYPRKGTIVADISMDLINCISEVRLLNEPYMARETVMQTMDFFLGVQLHFTIDLYKLLIESIRFRSSSKRNFFAKGY